MEVFEILFISQFLPKCANWHDLLKVEYVRQKKEMEIKLCLKNFLDILPLFRVKETRKGFEPLFLGPF